MAEIQILSEQTRLSTRRVHHSSRATRPWSMAFTLPVHLPRESAVYKKRRNFQNMGARLRLYPPGINLYRCSRGIKRPEVWQTTERGAQAEISGMSLTYEKTISVTDESGTVRNIINYRTYTKTTAESDNKKHNTKETETEEK